MKNSFIWSDNWWVENEKAWFVDGETNILFQIDLNTQECKLIAELPNIEKNTFRLNPRCIKYENDIYCMPDTGDCIWVYQLECEQFTQIQINTPPKVRLGVNFFWIYNEKIWAVSVGLSKILEIDTNGKKIDNYYNIGGQISTTIMVQDSIYCVSPVKNCIYQFDLVTKKCIEHIIPNVKGGLRTICFNSDSFWLSGYHKEIYIWNKEKNMVKMLDKFPIEFGIYNYEKNNKLILDCDSDCYDVATFLSSIFVGRYIWFIPFRTNRIIYVDKDTYEINVFEILEEEETESSLLSNRMKHKYLLEYIRDNRYIGLYSLKNKCMLEIDTNERKIEWREYFFNNESLQKMAFLFDEQKMVFLEENSIYREAYKIKLEKNNIAKKDRLYESIGLKIYRKIC